MPTLDLPVELWLEILAYLPRSILHKMIGINRTLFELALNDLYEGFISNDQEMMKSFKQLKHEGIARRVRRLFIRPAFLPGMDKNDSRSKLERKVALGMTYIQNIARNWSSSSDETKRTLQDSSYSILNVAKKAVRCCPNLREITIMLQDHTVTSAFMSFLASLWASKSIGPNLRKLTIDTTVAKIPLLLKPLGRHSKVLTNLEEFDLNLSISRRQHTSTQWYLGSQALTSFFRAFDRIITSVSIASMVMGNLGELFETFPRLRKLRKLQVLTVINRLSLPKPEAFTYGLYSALLSRCLHFEP